MAPKAARFVNLFPTGALTANELGSWVVLHPALRELPQQPMRALSRPLPGVTEDYARSDGRRALVSLVPVLSLVSDRRSLSFLFGLAGMLPLAFRPACDLYASIGCHPVYQGVPRFRIQRRQKPSSPLPRSGARSCRNREFEHTK